MSPRAAHQCSHCHQTITGVELSFAPVISEGTTRLTYKVLRFCQPECVRLWAEQTTFGHGDDPLASP